jgi:hypothetical protein
MSLFFLNKTFIERLDKHRRHFLWHGKKEKRAIIWSSGLKFAALKTKGALGSKNFERKTLTFFVNGDGSLKHKMACGKLF